MVVERFEQELEWELQPAGESVLSSLRSRLPHLQAVCVWLFTCTLTMPASVSHTDAEVRPGSILVEELQHKTPSCPIVSPSICAKFVTTTRSGLRESESRGDGYNMRIY